jgi:predicted nucleic acid-binding protein
MATMAVDPVFVDTSVLVYARVAVSPFHSAAVTKLDDLKAAGHPFWVSRQILREYLAALTKPATVTPLLPIAALVTCSPSSCASSLRRMATPSPPVC